MLERLQELWERTMRDHELLRALLRSAAQLAQALSGMRLSEPPESAYDLPAWLQEYDRVATAARSPGYLQWMGARLVPTPQVPALPWSVIAAQYARREPGIAAALRSAAQAYGAIARDGSAELRAAISDDSLRLWASERLAREQATGPGTGLQERPLGQSQGSLGGLLVGLAAAGAIVSGVRNDSRIALAAIGVGGFFLARAGSRAARPVAAATTGQPGARAPRQIPRQNTGEGSQSLWAQHRFALARALLEVSNVAQAVSGSRDIDRVALAVVAHWGLETGLGQNEDNGNVGNIRWFSGNRFDWFLRGRLRWRAYPTVSAGAQDYLSLVAGTRYGSAFSALVAGATPQQYATRLVELGYSNVAQAQQIGRSVQSVADQLRRMLSLDN